MILGWLIRCDACGTEEKNDDATRPAPAGWLTGQLQLTDVTGQEGTAYGQICPACTELPVRDLLVSWRAHREAEAARKARLA